jgi:hypothetical protein
MGIVEFTLYSDAHRRWLARRDGAIRAGITDPAQVGDAVVQTLRQWAKSPNPLCGGVTPRAAIARERKARTP